MTRKGSKQLTDNERASKVASPTPAPGKTEGTVLKDTVTLTSAKRKSSTLWTPEILQGAREVQEKRANMTKEKRAIDIEKTRLSLGMHPIEIVRDMKESDRQRKERDKQRGNPKRPPNDNDNDNDKRDNELFPADSDNDDGGNDPDSDDDPDDDNNPDDDRNPDDKYTQSTDDEKTKKKNRSKRKKSHKCHPYSQKYSLGMTENTRWCFRRRL